MFFFLVLSFLAPNLFSDTIKAQNTASISSQTLQHFTANPEPVKKLISQALDLATKNLGYLYGSADPDKKGMDCSGTINYLLNKAGIKEVPRSSDLIFQWVNEKGRFYAVTAHELSSSQFAQLRPGDLLFWSGTYAIKRKLDVTHVMLYLGKNGQGKPLMIGASDGRTYQGKKVYGVSVFDFQLPDAGSKSKFLGYGCIPQLSCSR